MTTSLYKRYAKLVIGTIEIKDLRFTFRIDRTDTSTPNKAEIDVYNLTEDHIGQIEKLEAVPVQLDAGYEDGFQTLFLGNLRTARTVEDGAGNKITRVFSGEGEVQIRKSRINVPVQPGAKADQVLRDVVKALGVAEGNLNEALSRIRVAFPAGGNVFPKGTVLTGSASREMTNITRSLGLEWSVQRGKLQIVERSKAVATKAVLLSKSTGMIGSPSVDAKGELTALSLLNPEIFPARIVVVDGERTKGQYLIKTCHDTGDTHGGSDWTTEIKAKAY